MTIWGWIHDFEMQARLKGKLQVLEQVERELEITRQVFFRISGGDFGQALLLRAGCRDQPRVGSSYFRYKEIADNLGIHTGTLNGYICNVYEKLQVHSRTEAVVKHLNRQTRD